MTPSTQTENDNLHHCTKTVQLDEPIQRGTTLISEVHIRKPKAGDLRGVTLIALGNLDVMALEKVLPRVTTPTLSVQEIHQLELADLMALGAEVSIFLATKSERLAALPLV